MKILIFGASGGTGRLLVNQGLQQGHIITAFVRNPEKMHITNNRLHFFQGNVLDPKSVEQAIVGQDVVISVLGNKTRDAFWKSNTSISMGVKHIIAGMQHNKVKRLIFVASFGLNKHIFLPEKLFIRIVLKNIFADIPLQEKQIRESGLEYTIVHPARLTNEPKTGKYLVGEELPIGIFSHISRADVADFLLKSIRQLQTFEKTFTLIDK